MGNQVNRSRRALLLRGRLRSPEPVVRLPWVSSEAVFLEGCTRCNTCVQACPEGIIVQGDGGFPEINFDRGGCTFCQACIAACQEPLFADPDSTAPWPYKQYWPIFTRPSAHFSLGFLTVGGFITGTLFWGGFNILLEATNTEPFCISCHEMRDNVFQELQPTIHYTNRSGVRATCSDCHVPKDWTHKIARKMQASKEVWGKVFGTINTPEKFEAKRLELAKREWARLKANDSLECRNCHNFDSMDFTRQSRRAVQMHSTALQSGEKTCIDCHKGIAHRLPPMAGVEGW